MSAASKLLIIEARFYDDLADALAEGAIKEIEAAGASYDRIAVPGCPGDTGSAVHDDDGDGKRWRSI